MNIDFLRKVRRINVGILLCFLICRFIWDEFSSTGFYRIALVVCLCVALVLELWILIQNKIDRK